MRKVSKEGKGAGAYRDRRAGGLSTSLKGLTYKDGDESCVSHRGRAEVGMCWTRASCRLATWGDMKGWGILE